VIGPFGPSCINVSASFSRSMVGPKDQALHLGIQIRSEFQMASFIICNLHNSMKHRVWLHFDGHARIKLLVLWSSLHLPSLTANFQFGSASFLIALVATSRLFDHRLYQPQPHASDGEYPIQYNAACCSENFPYVVNDDGSSVFEQANSSVQADGFASNDYAVSAANLSNFPNTEQIAQIDDSALAFTNFPPVEPGFSELNSLTYLSDLSRPAFANTYGSNPQDIPLHPLDHGIEPSRIPTVDLSDIA